MFRAESLDAATMVYAGMFGFNGLDLPIRIAEATQLAPDQLADLGIQVVEISARPLVALYGMLFILGGIVMLAPNVYEMERGFNPGLMPSATKNFSIVSAGLLLWRANAGWGSGSALLQLHRLSAC